jgi:hypothetical protein
MEQLIVIFSVETIAVPFIYSKSNNYPKTYNIIINTQVTIRLPIPYHYHNEPGFRCFY